MIRRIVQPLERREESATYAGGLRITPPVELRENSAASNWWLGFFSGVVR
jgi:hypothetical protein